MKDNIVVLGGEGVVGQASRKLFNAKYSYDIKKSNITLNQAHHNCLFFVICLPTPVKDGNYQVDEITAIVKQVASMGQRNIFVIRSTVYPGYGKFLHKQFGVPVVSHPEFGDSKSMYEDMKNPDFVVLGADSDSYWALDRFQKEFYPDVPAEKLVITDNVTAEQIKVSLNAFYALKVVFANEIYRNCESTQANYDLVKYVFEHSRYGSRNHFDIYHKGGRGAGGACLKKDLEFFTDFTNSDLFRMVNRINQDLLVKYHKTE